MLPKVLGLTLMLFVEHFDWIVFSGKYLTGQYRRLFDHVTFMGAWAVGRVNPLR